MNHRIITGASVAGVLALAFGASALSKSPQQTSGGTTLPSQGQGPAVANFHRFTVPLAISDGNTETMVHVFNGSTNPVDIIVEWYHFDGTLKGTSSVSGYGSKQMFNFTTATSGIVPPYLCIGAYRSSSDFLYGFAKVFVGPGSGSGKNVLVTAKLVHHLGDGAKSGNATNVTDLHVFRADDPDADGFDDSRFKGD